MAVDPESYLAQAVLSSNPDEAMGYLAQAVDAINREAKESPERLQERIPVLRRAVKSVAEGSGATGYSISVDDDVSYDVEWVVEGPVELGADQRCAVPPTSDQALWIAIRNSAAGIIVLAALVVLARSERSYRSKKRVRRAIGLT